MGSASSAAPSRCTRCRSRRKVSTPGFPRSGAATATGSPTALPAGIPLGRHSTLWYKEPLDTALLNEGASRLLGLQDFRSYCKPREGATTIRELQRFEFTRGADGVIVATVQADAFCHNMVRSLVGSALYVGTGEEQPGWLYERLIARQRDARSVLAAPHPLVLEEVAYPSAAGLLARAELTRARRA